MIVFSIVCNTALLLLLLLLPLLLLLDSPVLYSSTKPSTRRSPSYTQINCILFQFLLFRRHRFHAIQASSPPPSSSPLILSSNCFFGLQPCLRLMLSWFMASQELRPWRGASCHEHVVIAMDSYLS